MAIEAMSQTNSAMATLGIGLISVASFGFLWYRRVKLDRREDLTNQRSIEEALKAAEMWRVLCENQTQRANDAEIRADRAIKEASENASRFGELEATIKHLQDTVESLNSRIDQLLSEPS